MKQFTFILIMTLLSPALAYSQTNGGLHVDGSHNFMVPVDSLDIRPWAADFTVSFTIDFDSIKDNATTSLLGLRSREWDGTDKADRGTMWVDCINDNDTMYLKCGFRYFYGIGEDTIELPADFSGIHTVALTHGTSHIAEDYIDRGNYSTKLFVDGKFVSDIRRPVSDLWWRETSHFVIGGSLSDALPYSGMLYDFKYYDATLNEEQMASSSDKENENYISPTCHWDFWDMTADEALDSYPNEGTMPGLQALTGDFLSDDFIPVINKDYEGFDKDSTLTFYVSYASGTVNELSMEAYTYSDSIGLWSNVDFVNYNFLITDSDGKYFNAMSWKDDLSKAVDVTENVEVGQIFYGDSLSTGFWDYYYSYPDSVIDIYYADGRKNIVTATVSHFDLVIYDYYCYYPYDEDKVVEHGVGGECFLNNRYIQGLGWINSSPEHGYSYNLRMLLNGNKCLFMNPVFKGDVAVWGCGSLPDSVEDAESSPASWHLLSAVVSSELVITDNSGKPVCPDRVSVTSISGTVYRCAVRDGGTVDVSSLPQGFYLLTATCGDVTQTLKFIKK